MSNSTVTNSPILVTGGRGAVARGLSGLLTAHDLPHRLASREPDSPGTIHCDLTDPATFPGALAGVRSVFLYAEAAAIDAFIKEAVTAGVEHVILLSSSSVLAPDAADSPLSASHLAVEEALLASPLRTTLLRPGSFASNARGWAWSLESGRPVHLPYPGSHCDPVHEADIAEAAFAVLTDPALAGRAYTLTGPHSLTFTTQLAILGGVLGRPVPMEAVSPEQWKSEVDGYIPAAYADALLAYWAANDGLPVEITDAVEHLTGHPARSFETWVEDHAAEFAATA
ncbi:MULTISPECIES: NAD(P)H-binding protein [unclassified Streptomyces]|uniref:NmrA family NAD(P)-binding protein n=1 Tax=unclassified Streptomyces TaxID=2593676 RepID=UPI001BEC324F|nr:MULTISPECIES: NAD(P)H-binding protein [unclassified Streptomyces]MBT2402601.1 NAD(P)H-binding protein [Streptomyces sp. ISL-21]MBT2607994.1 NAD(P)H-binding protein [Streptomyces sp. ISL-87]